jgi:DNA repair exonuclease SbcCD ATPase subunit
VFEEYNEQLAAVKEKLRQRDKWTAMLRRYREDLQTAEATLEEADRYLREEEEQLAKLQGLTLSHLFYSLLGKQSDKVEATQQALLAAKLRYETAARNVHFLQQDIADLEQRLAALGDVDAQYNEVLQRKEQALLSTNAPDAAKISELSHDEAGIRVKLKEVDEALAAAEPALSTLNACLESLDKARGWGTWDMLGGGMISTAMKRNHMDTAQELVYEAQQHLRRFQRELEDLHIHLDVQISSDAFLRFADYFFDNLIVDWMVQNELKESYDQVCAQRDAVDSLKERLVQERDDLAARLHTVVEERRRMIERAGGSQPS